MSGIKVIIVLLLSLNTAATAEIVASIRPLHALVDGVMQGVENPPQLMIRNAVSPHTYRLQPSDARMLENAKVVFWLGENLEPALARSITQLARKAQIINLSQSQGLTLLEIPTNPKLSDTHHDDSHHHHGHDDHEEIHQHGDGVTDPHLWLDPRNAQLMIKNIAEILATIYPKQRENYRNNSLSLQNRLDELTVELENTLMPVRNRPFAVYHHAYRYLVHRFGLQPPIALAIHPEIPLSAARLQRVRERIMAAGIRCVFAEPQFPSRAITMLAHDQSLQVAILDPIGVDLPTGEALYFALLRQNANALRDCLSY